MIVVLFVLISGVRSFVDEIPRIKLGKKTLEGSTSITKVWTLESIFNSDLPDHNKIVSYSIEGLNPCIIQDPYLSLREFYSYESYRDIMDFDLLGSNVYYMDGHTVYSINLVKAINNEIQLPRELFVLTPYRFTYFNIFKFSNSDIVFFFKNEEPRFFYVVKSSDKGNLSAILATNTTFDDFNEKMKITVYKDYVFIPAGNKGIFVYQYMPTLHQMQFIKRLSFIQDARDIALKEVSGNLLGAAADYNKGIVTFSLVGEELALSDIKTWKEFLKVKSVTWINKEKENKLLLVIDALDGASKYVVLSLQLTPALELSYDQIKLLDGVANYGDASEDYATIIMPNSLMIIEIAKEGESITGYINSENINHAKVVYVNAKLGNWLIVANDKKLLFTNLIKQSGHLLCYAGKEEKNYNFTILGKSHSCDLNIKKGDCYYQVDITLQILDKQYHQRIRSIGIIIGFTVLVIIVAICIALIVSLKKYKNAKESLARYERLHKEQNIKVVGPSIEDTKISS